MLRALLLSLVTLTAVTANANTVTLFLDNSFPTTSGGLTTIHFNTGHVMATISRPGVNNGLDVENHSSDPTFPASWGNLTLSPFINTTNVGININFNSGVSVFAVSIDMGDFSGDVDNLSLQAFSGLDGGGTLLAQASGVLQPAGSAFTFSTLSVSATNIRSIRFIGGNGDNSVYYDNIRIDFHTLPEPTTLLLLLAGSGMIIGRLRKTGR